MIRKPKHSAIILCNLFIVLPVLLVFGAICGQIKLIKKGGTMSHDDDVYIASSLTGVKKPETEEKIRKCKICGKILSTFNITEITKYDYCFNHSAYGFMTEDREKATKKAEYQKNYQRIQAERKKKNAKIR